MMKHLLLIGSIVLLTAVACGKNADEQRADLSNVEPQPMNISVDEVLGDWLLISIDGVSAAGVGGLNHDRYVGFKIGQPCYETGDKYCNPEDGGWDPVSPQAGRFSIRGFSGCNSFGGEARLTDGIVESKQIIATQVGCPDISTQENQLFTILASKARVTLEADRLIIRSLDGGELELMRSDLQ